MTANAIGQTYTELRRWIGREIGKSRTSADWDATTLTDIADILKAGLRQFYWPPILPGENVAHLWSWLFPTLAQLELHAAYDTGTVSITTGTVTLAAGTWPSWAAAGELWVDDAWYSVASRSSDSVIVLDNSAVTGLSGETYQLIHREYDLPDDFGNMVEPFTYRQDQSRSRPLTRVNEAMVRSLEDYPRRADAPEYFAIVSEAPVTTEESRYRAIFSPSPDATIQLWYRYSVIPPMLDGTTYVYAHGGADCVDALRLSCLDQALQTIYGSDEKHGAFMETLRAAVLRARGQ